MIKNSDEAIERVLTGLRDAETPPGMHRRIQNTMQTREVVASTTSWGWRFAVAMCPLAMATLLLVTITVGRHQPVAVHHAASFVARQASTPLQSPPRAAKREPATHLQRVSYPPPPLPLTEQEKLLLRLTHGRDAKNMAVLNPEVRAAQTAKATTDFQHFFAIDPKEMRSQIE